MPETPPPENARPGLRLLRFLRTRRSAAIFAVTSLIAPLGFIAAATTVVQGVTVTPAAAAPHPLVVSGDAASRNPGGGWTFLGSSDFDELKSLITNAANFGPSGTVKAQFVLSGTPVTHVSDAALANVDVFVAGAVGGVTDPDGYASDETAALLRFVQRGGVLIANTNSTAFDVTSFIGGTTVKNPPARWESGPSGYSCLLVAGHDCAGNTQSVQEFSAPAASPIVAPANPLAYGPFGTVTSIRNWHTVTGFTHLPGEAQVVAQLNTPCVESDHPSCTPAPPPPTTTGAGTTTTTTAPPSPPQTYNNNIPNLPVVATLPFGSSFGAGAIVLSSDVDTFSSHADYGGAMQPGNRLMALNMFAWIGQHFIDQFGQGYTAMVPTRELDTRNAIGGDVDPIHQGQTRSVHVAGVFGVPVDATAVALNVTATRASGPSFLTVFPTGEAQPNASNLNFPAGATIANMVVMKVGAGGMVSIFNETGNVDVIADVVGYWRAGFGDLLTSIAPNRAADTRASTKLDVGESRAFAIAGQFGVPSNASAVVLNVTATNATAGGYFTVYPSDAARPNASNLNFAAGQNIPNLVISKVGADGAINVFNEQGQTDVIIDVMGYFGPSGGSIHPLSPNRLLDTRTGTGVAAPGKIGNGGVVNLVVDGAGGVPSAGASTVVLNVTAAAPDGAGYLTVWPEGGPPYASNLNFSAGQTIPNLVVARIASDGKVRILNVSAGTHIIADVVAWFD